MNLIFIYGLPGTGKLTDPNKLNQWLEYGTYYSPILVDKYIVDNTNLTPEDAAKEILKQTGL